MPLKAPDLDIRRFDELKRLALLRIPRYTPEWNDFNESDPGVTLVELFAWLTEMMLFQMNQIPQRNYIKFLQLLGLELGAAEPARAHLTFTPRPGAEARSVLHGSQILAQVPGGAPRIFETTTGLDLIRLPLSQVRVFDGAGFTDVTTANQTPGIGYRPFGWTPQAGCALYLGFDDPPPGARVPQFPQQMRFRVFLPEHEVAGEPIVCQNGEPAPAPRVELVWEYDHGGMPGVWHRLKTNQDDTAAFTREGYIVVEGPPRDEDYRASAGDVVPGPPYRLRVRIISGNYPAGREPHIDFIRPNVVEAENLNDRSE